MRLITSAPIVLAYRSDNIREKILDLVDLGFADPVKMISSKPTILGYTTVNIREKIANLRQLGFAIRSS